MKKKITTPGFSILELIIVLALLAILASAAVAKFVDISEKSLQVQEMATIDSFRTAILLYKAKYNDWPSRGAASCTVDNNPFRLLENAPPYECNLVTTDNIRWSLINSGTYWMIRCPHQTWGCRGASCRGNEWHYYTEQSLDHYPGKISKMDTGGHH